MLEKPQGMCDWGLCQEAAEGRHCKKHRALWEALGGPRKQWPMPAPRPFGGPTGEDARCRDWDPADHDGYWKRMKAAASTAPPGEEFSQHHRCPDPATERTEEP